MDYMSYCPTCVTLKQKLQEALAACDEGQDPHEDPGYQAAFEAWAQHVALCDPEGD